LVRVAEYHHAEGLRKLNDYNRLPHEDLEVEIARHMVLVDVAMQLLKWDAEGEDVPLTRPGGEPKVPTGSHVLASTWKAIEFFVQSLREEGNEDAARRWEEEMERLRPYWDRPGVTLEEALAAFSADHPDAPVKPKKKRGET
jgi:hypothetical protein